MTLYGVHGAFLELLYWNWFSYKFETGVSGNLWSCLKEIKPLVVYDVQQGIALEPVEGNRMSFHIDMGYPKLFYIPAVKSVFF